MTKIVAVAGKGGVGKTSLAGAFVKVLVEKYPDKKILAIDADPAVGLSTVLNIEVDKTIAVSYTHLTLPTNSLV